MHSGFAASQALLALVQEGKRAIGLACAHAACAHTIVQAHEHTVSCNLPVVQASKRMMVQGCQPANLCACRRAALQVCKRSILHRREHSTLGTQPLAAALSSHVFSSPSQGLYFFSHPHSEPGFVLTARSSPSCGFLCAGLTSSRPRCPPLAVPHGFPRDSGDRTVLPPPAPAPAGGLSTHTLSACMRPVPVAPQSLQGADFWAEAATFWETTKSSTATHGSPHDVATSVPTRGKLRRGRPAASQGQKQGPGPRPQAVSRHAGAHGQALACRPRAPFARGAASRDVSGCKQPRVYCRTYRKTLRGCRRPGWGTEVRACPESLTPTPKWERVCMGERGQSGAAGGGLLKRGGGRGEGEAEHNPKADTRESTAGGGGGTPKCCNTPALAGWFGGRN